MTPRTRSWDLATSAALVMPLLLTYQVAVLFAGNVNGADVVTRSVYGALGRTCYLLLHVAAAAAFLLWIRRSGRAAALRLAVVGPLVIEAAIYAVTLAAVIALVIDRWLHLALNLGSVVDALGAGVYEELVFRLAVMGGLIAVLRRYVPRMTVAVVLALALSAGLFAVAHHVGAHGEPFTDRVFAVRCLAGVVFGLIWWFRSFAHAVYAHSLYDLLVYARG